MMRAVLDTRVIIDVLQRREPFWRDAAELFRAAANDEFLGIVTAKSLTDVFYLMHRHTHDNGASRSVVNRLAQLFEVADTASDDVMLALAYDMPDFEDAVMSATAQRVQASCVATRNLDDYRASPVPAVDPASLLRELRPKAG